MLFPKLYAFLRDMLLTLFYKCAGPFARGTMTSFLWLIGGKAPDVSNDK